LPSELFEAASAKASDEDLTLAQVLRRFLREWVQEEGAEKLEKEEE